MDANEFWLKQFKKNEDAKPRYTVSTDPQTAEEQFMRAWIDKWQEQFAYFNNIGCGCCVNIYEFDAPEEAVSEVPIGLLELYGETNRPVKTGMQSNFQAFSHPVKGQPQ